jgi:hypothetical protein
VAREKVNINLESTSDNARERWHAKMIFLCAKDASAACGSIPGIF